VIAGVCDRPRRASRLVARSARQPARLAGEETGRIEAEYQHQAARLLALDVELAEERESEDAAGTKQEKTQAASAVARLDKQRERLAAKLTERDERIAEARRRAEGDRKDVGAVGDELISLYADSDELLKHARVVGLEEIEENDFNLNIPRYVDTFEPEPRVEMRDALKALREAEAAAKAAEARLTRLLRGAGYAD